MIQALSYHEQTVNQVHILPVGNDLLAWTRGTLAPHESDAYARAVDAMASYRNMLGAIMALEAAGFEVLVV